MFWPEKIRGDDERFTVFGQYRICSDWFPAKGLLELGERDIEGVRPRDGLLLLELIHLDRQGGKLWNETPIVAGKT